MLQISPPAPVTVHAPLFSAAWPGAPFADVGRSPSWPRGEAQAPEVRVFSFIVS